MRNIVSGMLLLLCLVLPSCQKAMFEEEGEEGERGNVLFRITQLEQVPFDQSDYTRTVAMGDACKMINLAVYKDGERVKQVNQKSSDRDFGTLAFPLDAGTYTVVILAHNGTKSPTMTKPGKVTFSDGVTDTFWWSDEVTVDGKTSVDVRMKRIVAMFRLLTTDNVPAAVKKMRFYYTGGSSTINALTGIGCVNSRQTVEVSVDADMADTPGRFEVYTFPRDDSEALEMKVTALGGGGESLYERKFEEVPVTRNMVTQYRGKFFSESGDDDPIVGPGDGAPTFSFGLTVDEEWSDVFDRAY